MFFCRNKRQIMTSFDFCDATCNIYNIYMFEEVWSISQGVF